jgi:hypothetical protein
MEIGAYGSDRFLYSTRQLIGRDLNFLQARFKKAILL